MHSHSASSRATRASALFAAGCAILACAAMVTPVTQASREYWAFTAPWDPRSATSVRANARHLDAVVTGWIQLDSITGQPFSEFPDTLSRTMTGARPMVIVANAVGGRFHAAPMRRLGRNPAALARAAGAIARTASAGGYRGMVIDIEALGPADQDVTRAVVRAIADSARARGVVPIAVAIPAVDTAAYPARAFIPAADYVLAMLYDEHWTTSPPGAVASPDFVRRALALRVAEVGPSRVVAALPFYGYLWPVNRPATDISFDDARREAASAGVELRRDPATQTLRASRPGVWELWVSDAGLLASLLREVDAAGVRRVAFWRLGQEDPAVYDLLQRR